MTNKKLLFKTTVLTVIQLTAYFSVSYWIYRSFNLNQNHLVYLITLQTLLYMAVSPIPTPGNIGANEITFFSIFNGVFPKSILGYAVLLYGALVYYFILINLQLIITLIISYFILVI